MKLSKFLFTMSSITLISLLYVYQQTEILRLAYVGEKRMVVFEDLLDKNTILRYNVGRGASLVQIGSKVYKNVDFQMPDTYRLVRLVPSQRNLRVSTQAFKGENLLSRLFGIKRQAEAKTINP